MRHLPDAGFPHVPPQARPSWRARAANRSLVLFPFLLLCNPIAAAATATLCIGPVPVATSGAKSLANASASDEAYDFTVTVGELPAVAVSHGESVAVTDLRVEQRHRVVIRQGGKPSASFAFTFEEHGSDRLCLWFGPLHESWSLWPLERSQGKCNCGAKQDA
jgi:hypothetical protein